MFCLARLNMDMPDACNMYDARVSYPDESDPLTFIVTVTPSRGIYKGGAFDFEFKIPENFPFQRPRVKCLTKVWHPNIDESGSVCLNILRDNYTPAMTISHLIAGLQFLFDEPNPASPLNDPAAQMYIRDYEMFVQKAHSYMSFYCKPLSQYYESLQG